LADKYVVHLPVDSGDVTPRYVGTNIATGQPVMIAVVSPSLAKREAKGKGTSHRHLATLIDVVEAPPPDRFPSGIDLPRTGTALVAELVRGTSLREQLAMGPLNADRAVAWTIRLLEGLAPLHKLGIAHGSISSAAVVVEPRNRAIAPVLSRLIVPPAKDYASPERLHGGGPSVSDDLWAVAVLLAEMLEGVRPLDVKAVANGELVLPADRFSFSKTAPLGKALEVAVRRSLSERSRRFASGEELAEVLDRWERRAALPSAWTEKSSRVAAFSAGRSPAAWDPLVDELAVSSKRLSATFDAAEQLRQSVLDDDGTREASRGRTSVTEGRSEREAAADDAHRQDARLRAVGAAEQSFDGSERGARSVEPTSRRRLGSMGPELAAFAERSRPKIKPWLLGGVITVVLGGLGLAAALHFDETTASHSGATSAVTKPREEPSGPRAKERPKTSAREETSECIRSYFREDALQKGVDLAFVCTDEDYLAVNRRLHEEATVPLTAPAAESPSASETGAAPPTAVAPVPSVTAEATRGTAREPVTPAETAASASANPALVIRSATSNRGWHLGWYELVATAIIRQNCCKEAAPIKLPESTGWCQQLQAVVRRIAQDSAKVGDISPGVRGFDETITCLLAQGKHVAYPYKAVPTSLQKAAFQQFLKHAAEVDAKRSSQR
jgi:hypothetical protein